MEAVVEVGEGFQQQRFVLSNDDDIGFEDLGGPAPTFNSALDAPDICFGICVCARQHQIRDRCFLSRAVGLGVGGGHPLGLGGCDPVW